MNGGEFELSKIDVVLEIGEVGEAVVDWFELV